MAAAVAALAAQEHARRTQEITDAFRRAGAITPARSRSLADLGVTDADAAESLVCAGVLVRGAGADTWHLDEAAAARRAAARAVKHRPAAYLMGGGLGVLLALAIAWWIKGG